VLWHLTRNPETPEVPQMEFDGENLTLRLDATIAEENPLLIADLEREEAYCEQFGLTTRLEFRL
jgi:hypothetical protein